MSFISEDISMQPSLADLINNDLVPDMDAQLNAAAALLDKAGVGCNLNANRTTKFSHGLTTIRIPTLPAVYNILPYTPSGSDVAALPSFISLSSDSTESSDTDSSTDSDSSANPTSTSTSLFTPTSTSPFPRSSSKPKSAEYTDTSPLLRTTFPASPTKYAQLASTTPYGVCYVYPRAGEEEDELEGARAVKRRRLEMPKAARRDSRAAQQGYARLGSAGLDEDEETTEEEYDAEDEEEDEEEEWDSEEEGSEDLEVESWSGDDLRARMDDFL